MNADAKTRWIAIAPLRGVPDGMLIDGDRVSATFGPNARSAEIPRRPDHREVPEGGKEDIDRAVQAACRSFDTRVWRDAAHRSVPRSSGELRTSSTPIRRRSFARRCGLQWHATGPRHLDGQSRAEAFRYFAGWVTKIHGPHVRDLRTGGNFHAFTMRAADRCGRSHHSLERTVYFACSKLSVLPRDAPRPEAGGGDTAERAAPR